MKTLRFDEAVDHAIAQAMAEDHRVVTWGEDVKLLRRNLLARFGPSRVRDTPISESAFMYAGVGAAMSGLRPVVELYMIDFAQVGLAAIVDGGSKFPAFSGGRCSVPMVLRAGYGGWYADGGQHEQALWGQLAGIPGVTVVVPSTPHDAAGLMLSSIQDEGFVVFLTAKLLDGQMLDYLGGASRPTVDFGRVVPAAGARGPVPEVVQPIPLGKAVLRREGSDVALVSVGVGTRRCLEAAAALAADGIEASVLDLRCIAPLDHEAVVEQAHRTGRIVVVDEDYRRGGLSGEIAALLLESGTSATYARVCVEQTIPFAPHLEYDALPNAERIAAAAKGLA